MTYEIGDFLTGRECSLGCECSFFVTEVDGASLRGLFSSGPIVNRDVLASVSRGSVMVQLGPDSNYWVISLPREALTVTPAEVSQ